MNIRLVSSHNKSIILNSLLMLWLTQATYAQGEPALKPEKTKMLGDYQVQLICVPASDLGESQKCKISIYNPNEPDKSKATVILPNTEILIEGENKEHRQSSLFSLAGLKAAEDPSDLELQKYKISRDWLFRFEMSDGNKKPNISILSPMVPYENKD